MQTDATDDIAERIAAILRAKGTKSHIQLAETLATSATDINDIVRRHPSRFAKLRIPAMGVKCQRTTLIAVVA